MKILVVLVTFNGMRWIDRCIASLDKSSLRPDVLMIDNASTDGTADYVEGHFPWVEVVRSRENLGFAEGNNMGLRRFVKGDWDYVYLLNQDAWVMDDTFEMIVKAFGEHPEMAVLSPVQVDANGIPDKNFAARVKPERTAGEVFEVPFVMAAHWMVRKTAVLSVGAFAPVFPIYGNDDNYCDRVRFHGMKVGVVRNAVAVHDRAWRVEPKEKVVARNYYVKSQVVLADPGRNLAAAWGFVIIFTIIKTFKYCSFLPLKYICKLIGRDSRELREVRRVSRQNGAFL